MNRRIQATYACAERGLPTEIEYMNDKIVQIGMMFKNVDVDVNVFFTSMIITREIRSGARQPEDIPDYLTGPYPAKSKQVPVFSRVLPSGL